MRDPSPSGPDKYVCLFGDLHIELELLRIHGELIKGSGLDAILESANGTSVVIDVNNNKHARYCLQVAVCAIYRFLVDAHMKDSDSSTPLHWLDGRSSTSQMCFYWKIILEFQIHILLFIRAIREGNYKLYEETLYQFLKYFFAFDKYNHSCWVPIYWFDLA